MANNVGVTNRGFEYLCNYMTGTATTANWTSPTYIGWGTVNQSNATSVVFPASSTAWTYVGPCAEGAEARVLGSPSVINNTQGNSAITYQLTGTMTCTQAGGENIGESFIAFNTAPSGKGQAQVGVGCTFLPASVSLTVASVTNLPSAPFQLQAFNETLNVTNITSSTVLTVTRAYNGSTSYAGTLPAGFTVTTGNVPGTGLSNPHTADTFAVAGFQALALNQNDSIAFTWQVNVTY